MSARLIHGDCVDVLRTLPESSVDAVVTDPPYGIGFMGHQWDQPTVSAQRPSGHVSSTPASLARVGSSRAVQQWTAEWATEVLRVLKPGGHLVSFASTRTNHRHACGLEDAGFEIRDTLAWLFGQGFPKSRNLTGQHEGWGSGLKPGHEPITLARAPLAHRSMTANMQDLGVGALHIDACRIPAATRYTRVPQQPGGYASQPTTTDEGRWPANVLLDEPAAAALDEQSGVLTSGANPTRRSSDKFRDVYGDFAGQEECDPARGTDVGGASRFFYCAKPGRTERDAGLDALHLQALRAPTSDFGSLHEGIAVGRNVHPTVKPIDLMRWLVRLVTPRGGVVLDPFTGSGTTGCAAVLEDCDFIGIEREAEYMTIAEARIRHWTPQGFQLTLDESAA